VIGTPLAVADDDPVSVRAIPIQDAVIRPEISAPAAVVSLSDSRIGAELNAPIKELPVRVGDVVEPGGVLARLECGDYDLAAAVLAARVEAAAARIRFAEQQLQRSQSLMERQIASQEQVDERESNLAVLLADRDASRADLDKAQRDLTKCIVRAPFKAVILERLASLGEYVRPGSAVVRVLDIDNLEVSAEIVASEAEALASRDEILFRYGGKDYAVSLRKVTPVIDDLTRTQEARLIFDVDAAPPGAVGRLVWKLGPALPADLVVRRGNQLGVLLAVGGAARFHALAGAEEGRPARVDLPAGTQIITEGRYSLSDGDAIRVVE
jgi:RND family efflux transporter MFP subunit